MLRFIQFLWLLPVTLLVWLFYVLPAWALGWIKFAQWEEPFIAKFHTNKKDGWFGRAWKDWWGWSGPCVIIIRGDINNYSLLDYGKTVVHELEHCHQAFRWGVLHYPAYILASVWIFLFEKDKHSYFDNPFERNARRAAGQPVEIDKSYWGYGTDQEDRWAWW